MKSLKVAFLACLLSSAAFAQQAGWLTRLEPDFAELRTDKGPLQFTLDSPQYQTLARRGLGSRWKVSLAPDHELINAEYLGISPAIEGCLSQAEQLLQWMDGQDWGAVYGSLSEAGKSRYSSGAVEDYWRMHWLSSLAGDRKLQQQSEDRCTLLVAGKGVSFGRYGQPMGSLHRLSFVKEGTWKLDSYEPACQSEWDK